MNDDEVEAFYKTELGRIAARKRSDVDAIEAGIDAIQELRRLREIIPKQGAAIDQQRNRNHNVEKARSKWRKRAETAERENERLWNGIHETTYYIEQAVADVFPEQFPLYPADWNAGDDRCVGEHVPESLVLLACNEIRRLRAELSECYRDGGCP